MVVGAYVWTCKQRVVQGYRRLKHNRLDFSFGPCEFNGDLSLETCHYRYNDHRSMVVMSTYDGSATNRQLFQIIEWSEGICVGL
jgi:hypothetical protein